MATAPASLLGIKTVHRPKIDVGFTSREIRLRLDLKYEIDHQLTSSHTETSQTGEIRSTETQWQPVRPPRRGASDELLTAFHAHILQPGFSIAFHAATLGRSRTSIATYRARARQAELDSPAVREAINAALSSLRPEHGLQMAQCRGKAQLPHWSLLAIAEYRERGFSRRELAAMFCCSLGTVAHALQFRNRSYEPLSGARRLTKGQQRPPRQFTKRASK